MHDRKRDGVSTSAGSTTDCFEEPPSFSASSPGGCALTVPCVAGEEPDAAAAAAEEEEEEEEEEVPEEEPLAEPPPA